MQEISVEVVVGEPRYLSLGSQFGHVAIIVDDKAYSRAHARYFTTDRTDYLNRNGFRHNVGYLLRVSNREKSIIRRELERRVKAFEHSPQLNKYSLLDNSCSSNVAEVLGAAGILAYDPRWSAFQMISPADIVTGLNHSKRLIKKIDYPKTR